MRNSDRKEDGAMEISSYNEIVQHWMNQVLENRGKDAESSLKFCQDIIQYGLRNGDCALVGFGYYYSGETYYLLNDGARFFREISKALEFLDKAREWELMGKCYNFLGIWATNRGNAPVALDYYLNGINYCRKNHLYQLEAIMNINVGAMNNQVHRFSEGQTYLEKAMEYMKAHTDQEGYHTYMCIIYENLAKSMIFQNKLRDVEELFYQIYHKHWNYVDNVDRLLVRCAEAIYFHKIGDTAKRDMRIDEVCRDISDEMPILDMFVDLYDFMELLLETDKDVAFWSIADIMEKLCGNCNIIHMQLQMISLKISFYRKHGQNAEYLQAAGLYYELSQIQNRETQDMINNVLNLRRSLEAANRMREEMEVQNRILMEKSELDPLTKLANRFRLNDVSLEIYQKVLRCEGTLAVEILDVDYFKEFNDNYGHQAGDNCLKAVSEAVEEVCRIHNGFCARYGGDEFVIIYQNLSKQDAMDYAAELKQKILAQKVPHEFSKAVCWVSVSQGICWGRAAQSVDVGDFLHRADEMLYRVKQVTRNNYCVGEIDEGKEALVGPKD